MIHNCWVFAMGNRHDLRETADWLAPFDQAMTDVYVARSGQKAEDVAKWLDGETFMSGSTAIERGFADALLAADQMKVDDDAKAADRSANEVRAMEMALIQSGMTRAQARARINKIKGTPGAALDPEGTPGAADQALTGAFAGLLTSIRS
jgi:ATP-dependent Clp protease protease subunit